MNLTIGVNGKDSVGWDLDASITDGIGYPVAEAGVKWSSVILYVLKVFEAPVEEQTFDVSKTSHLENFWLFQYDFTPQRSHGSVRTENHWTFGQFDAILIDTIQISSGSIGSAGRSGSQVHDVVTVLLDVIKQFGHARMCPILSKHVEHMAQGIRLGDCAINIGNHNGSVGLPQIEIRLDE